MINLLVVFFINNINLFHILLKMYYNIKLSYIIIKINYNNNIPNFDSIK